MALTKEYLAAEGIAEEQAEKILKEYDADVIGLKAKRDEILAKNVEYKTNLEKHTSEWTAKESNYQKLIDDYETKLKASGSDELKAFYESEKKQIQDMFSKKLEEQEKAIGQSKGAYDQLYGDYLRVLKNTELDQAMDKHNNLDPSMRSILRDVFWARYKFDFKEVEGKKSLMNDDYRGIGDTLTAFIATDEGKRFILNGSTGGGATGSSTVKPAIGNPFIKGKENLDEQARLLRENRSLYESFKAQAAALNKS